MNSLHSRFLLTRISGVEQSLSILLKNDVNFDECVGVGVLHRNSLYENWEMSGSLLFFGYDYGSSCHELKRMLVNSLCGGTIYHIEEIQTIFQICPY